MTLTERLVRWWSCNGTLYMATWAVTRHRTWARSELAVSVPVSCLLGLGLHAALHNVGPALGMDIAIPAPAVIAFSVTVVLFLAVTLTNGLPGQRELAATQVLTARGVPLADAARQAVDMGRDGRRELLSTATG